MKVKLQLFIAIYNQNMNRSKPIIISNVRCQKNPKIVKNHFYGS